MNEEELEQTEQTEQPTPPAPPLLPLAAPVEREPLNTLAETVAAKADAAALEPIHAALAALGSVPEGAHNLLIAGGTYQGNGRSGYANKITLTFPFYPVMVWLEATDNESRVCRMLRGVSNPISTSSGTHLLAMWQNDCVIYWDANSAAVMKNESSKTYQYYGIGYALPDTPAGQTA